MGFKFFFVLTLAVLELNLVKSDGYFEDVLSWILNNQSTETSTVPTTSTPTIENDEIFTISYEEEWKSFCEDLTKPRIAFYKNNTIILLPPNAQVDSLEEVKICQPAEFDTFITIEQCSDIGYYKTIYYRNMGDPKTYFQKSFNENTVPKGVKVENMENVFGCHLWGIGGYQEGYQVKT